MSRNGLVVLLGAVVALAVAIPALAESGTTAKSASVKGLSTRALAKAKVGLRIARAARRDSHKAAGLAAAAQSAATGAKAEATQAAGKAASAREVAGGAELKAGEAKAEVAASRSKSGFAEGSVSTESLPFAKLANGPAVTVDVPTSGLVQVWAQALVEGPGAVSLYEEGKQVQGQASDCNGAKGVLFAVEAPLGEPIIAATPAAFDVSGSCATLGAPGPVLFQATTGVHSFELRYATCTCGGPVEPATFSERHLIVAPLP